MFALPEIINNAARLKEIPVVNKVEKKFFHMLDFQSIKKNIRTLLRSSVIGTVIGILPGLGGGPAALVSYAAAKKASKTPEEFGKGCEEGVFASETANNATTGGALIPLLSLSVPGSEICGRFLYICFSGRRTHPGRTGLLSNTFGN